MLSGFSDTWNRSLENESTGVGRFGDHVASDPPARQTLPALVDYSPVTGHLSRSVGAMRPGVQLVHLLQLNT